MNIRSTEGVVICSFGNRVSPRFDMTQEIIIFDPQNPKGEEIDVSLFLPEEKVNLLAQMRVKVLVIGGIQERYQQMLLNTNIRVIWGVIGEVHDVMEAYAKGILYPGIGDINDQKIKRPKR